MIFYKFRAKLRNNSMKPFQLVFLASIALIALAWLFPLLLNAIEMTVFDIPIAYFYIIIIGPALILSITNWICKIEDDLDRRQLETENE